MQNVSSLSGIIENRVHRFIGVIVGGRVQNVVVVKKIVSKFARFLVVLQHIPVIVSICP